MQPMNTNTTRTSRNGSTDRRGTILILAIAVLAVLSLLAVSYVTVVRVDRDSSDAVAVSRDFDQQVGTVVRHMQSLLTADLFGNKVVTTSVPRFTADGIAIWPSMFEDGEFVDIDTIDRVYAAADPGQDPSFQNGKELQVSNSTARRVAFPDDAWLASTEPRFQNHGFPGQPYFEQFTNLRSAFTWDTTTQTWVRGDGLYVDLAQWFLNRVDGRANAGVDLLDPTGSEVTEVRSAEFSRGEHVRNVDNVTFDVQVAQLDNNGSPTVLEPSDERRYVDTDGDLRPDAQWTQLEDLGNLFGLNWIVAARMTDASALANLNTAIESPAYSLNPGTLAGGRDYSEVVGTGETPADVDLVRILTYDYALRLPSGLFPNGTPNLNRILGDGTAFQNHLNDGRGFRNVLDYLSDNDNPGGVAQLDPVFAGTGQTPQDWAGLQQPLTRSQRRYTYEIAYSTLDQSYARANRYPERALLDLHAFWGTNNATLISKPEQYLDGPEAGGYLPSATVVPGNGPLRAAEVSVPATRAFGAGASGLPTVQQLEYDNRRQLTTVSGTGTYCPVPVVNKGQLVDEFDSVFFRPQHRLWSTERDRVDQTFADLMWALAPFATNKELYRPSTPNGFLTSNQPGTPDLHYGGGANGPAQRFATAYNDARIGAGYALHRAGALAVNIANSFQPDFSADDPAVLRFFPTTQEPAQLPLLPGYDQRFANGRFAHGDLELEAGTPPISDRYVGRGFGGISFIGLQQQPFLVEAQTVSVYQTNTLGSTVTIDPNNPNNWVGSIFAVELANPWPEDVLLVAGDLPGGIVIRVQRDESWIDFLPNINTVIPAGGRIVLYWSSEPGSADPTGNAFEPFVMEQIVSGWTTRAGAGAETPQVEFVGHFNSDAMITNAQSSLGGDDSIVMPFQRFATQLSGRTQVQLIRRRSDDSNAAFSPPAPERKGDILVDRMTTGLNSQVFGDGIVWNDFFGAMRASQSQTFETVDGQPFRGGFRQVVYGNMRRAPQRPSGNEGFPGYVVEKPDRNELNVVGHTFASGPGSIPGGSFRQAWSGDPNINPVDPGPGGGGGGDEGEGDITDPLAGPEPTVFLTRRNDAFTLGDDSERAIFDGLPEYQLFLPGTQLSSVSDVLLLPAFCHMYLHNEQGYPNAGYSVLRVNEFSTRYQNNNQGPLPDFQSTSDTGGRWLTFSEQLGFDFHLDGDLTSPGTIDPNPWFGRINPTLYRFGSTLNDVANLPDHMRVPLGSRIVDLFTTLRPRDFITPGTVNVNTATRRLLGALPMTEPLQAIADGSSSGFSLVATPPTSGFGGANSRAGIMYDYRERKGNFGVFANARENWTGLAGLRDIAANGDPNSAGYRGFVSKGEIALLGRFDATGTPLPGQTGTFLEVGASPLNTKGPPMETWSDTGLPYSFGPPQDRAYGRPDYNPASDAEEQLALFRAVANIVSTRSDVFMATFVLRGYDPDIIESIEVPGNGEAAALQAMNDPLFRPAYESRWLVVFDRSNVRQPTDRPRLLLRMELPSAVP